MQAKLAAETGLYCTSFKIENRLNVNYELNCRDQKRHRDVCVPGAERKREEEEEWTMRSRFSKKLFICTGSLSLSLSLQWVNNIYLDDQSCVSCRNSVQIKAEGG